MLITLVFDLNLWGLGFIITYGKIDHPKCRSLSLVLLSPFSPFLILASTVCFHFFPIASFPQPRQYFAFLSFPSLKPINVSASSLSIRCPGISFSLISLSFLARFFGVDGNLEYRSWNLKTGGRVMIAPICCLKMKEVAPWLRPEPTPDRRPSSQVRVFSPTNTFPPKFLFFNRLLDNHYSRDFHRFIPNFLLSSWF